MNPAAIDPFIEQTGRGNVGGGKQQLGYMVGEDPVDLLRHAPIEGAQAGFDMRDRNVQLRRRQSPCQSGVGIAVDQHQLGTHFEQRALDRFQHPAGLGAVEA